VQTAFLQGCYAKNQNYHSHKEYSETMEGRQPHPLPMLVVAVISLVSTALEPAHRIRVQEISFLGSDVPEIPMN